MKPVRRSREHAPSPWIGGRILERQEDELHFSGTNYPVWMTADADRLTWSVPDAVATSLGTKRSFESGLERISLRPSIEAWRFPKLEREPAHEVVLFVDRDQGTVASVELMLRQMKSGLRPDLRVVRGSLSGYPLAYGGFAFPRRRHDARRIAVQIGGLATTLVFDRTGQPTAVEHASSSRRVTGHSLSVIPGLWVVAWRGSEETGLVVFDDDAELVNGQTLTLDGEQVETFGVRATAERLT